MATQVAEPVIGTVERTDIDTTIRQLRPWNVLVWDDDVTPMDFVVDLFMTLFSYDEQKATSLMLQIHLTGKTIVISCPRERAEYYAEYLGKAGMGATIEEG